MTWQESGTERFIFKTVIDRSANTENYPLYENIECKCAQKTNDLIVKNIFSKGEVDDQMAVICRTDGVHIKLWC